MDGRKEWKGKWTKGQEDIPRLIHPAPCLHHSRVSRMRWTPRSKGNFLCGSCRMQRGMLLAHPARSSVASSLLWSLWFMRTVHLETSCWKVRVYMKKEMCVWETCHEPLLLYLWFWDIRLLGGSLFRLDQLKTYLHSSCQRSWDFWCQYNMGLAVNATWYSHWEKRKNKVCRVWKPFPGRHGKDSQCCRMEKQAACWHSCGQHSCSQYGPVSSAMGARLRLIFLNKGTQTLKLEGYHVGSAMLLVTHISSDAICLAFHFIQMDSYYTSISLAAFFHWPL